MRIRRSDAADGVNLTVAGLGAYTLLRPEAGLHVLEVPVKERGFHRVPALVGVAAADAASEPLDGAAEPAIVRRYRHLPSPLVRDAAGVRTGRIDRVLGGDFDLVAETAP
jgi:ATP-dependent Clp protease ATP-binding subunit ClpC